MTRLAAFAGQFYPGDKKELEEMVDGLLCKAEALAIKGEIFGLLLPHAGYVYSGQIAAYGFKAIAAKAFAKVIIIADSHCERFDGISVWSAGEWETPLGKVGVDTELAKQLLTASPRFFRRDSAHLFEHSIEVQLPFLQKTLKDFKILPIVFGSEDEDWQVLAEAILKNINKKVLIIASADLSHYLPYDEARKIDKKTLDNVIDLQNDNLEVCATDSVKTLVEITKKLGGRAKLLKYANSGDMAGDKSQVVGYGAVAFYR